MITKQAQSANLSLQESSLGLVVVTSEECGRASLDNPPFSDRAGKDGPPVSFRQGSLFVLR